MSGPHAGLNAIVTGGASGLGLGLATELLDGGANVVLADRNLALGKTVAETASTKYGAGRVLFVELDVTSWESTVAAFAASAAFFEDKGGLDLVFPNAGAVSPGFPDISDEEEPNLSVFAVNVNGVLLTIQAAVNSFRKRTLTPVSGAATPAAVFRSKFKGKIVATASVTGLYTTPCHVVYSASKHAVCGAVRSLGPRLARDNITVNGVAPNLVATAMSPGDMYKAAQENDILTPMSTVITAFTMPLGESEMTGEIIEATGDLASVFKIAPFRDEQTARSFDVLYQPYGICEKSRLPVLQKEAADRVAARKQK